jgi:hypothetical protein
MTDSGGTVVAAAVAGAGFAASATGTAGSGGRLVPPFSTR